MPGGFLDVTAKLPELLRFQNQCAIGYAPSRCGLCTVAASGVSGYLSRFLRRAFTGGSDPAFANSRI